MPAPYEIILSAAEVWTAPFGQSYPLVNYDVNPALWNLLGTAGSLNRSEEGITITSSQELFDVRVDGSAYPVKQGRTSEELVIAMTMYDLSLHELSVIFNDNAVSGVFGSPAWNHMQLERGPIVNVFTMIIRHPSPYNNDQYIMQWELHKVSHRGSSEIAMRRTAPAGVRMEFVAQADTNRPPGQRVGRVVAQSNA